MLQEFWVYCQPVDLYSCLAGRQRCNVGTAEQPAMLSVQLPGDIASLPDLITHSSMRSFLCSPFSSTGRCATIGRSCRRQIACGAMPDRCSSSCPA